MKKLLLTLIASLALLAPAIAGQNEKFTGNTQIQSGSLVIKRGVAVSIETDASVTGLVRKFELGAPIAAAANTIVASANCKTTAHTLAITTLDVPRNVSVTVTTAGSADVAHDYVITGTDYNGNALTETITCINGSTVAGTKAFKTVSSVVSAGWVINATSTSTADTVTVGVGALLGLPVSLASTTTTLLTTVGSTVGSYATTRGTLATSTVAASGGTYNGSNKVTVYLDK